MQYLAIILLLAFASCKQNDNSQEPIPEEHFLPYYTDFLVLRQEGLLSGSDSLKMKSRVDSLNSSYGFSESRVETTLRWYRGDLSRWKNFYEQVIKRLEFAQQPDSTKVPLKKN